MRVLLQHWCATSDSSQVEREVTLRSPNVMIKAVVVLIGKMPNDAAQGVE
jgi:hypothetical protein